MSARPNVMENLMKMLRFAFVLGAVAILAGGCASSDDPTGPPIPPANGENEPNDFNAQTLGTLSSTDFEISATASSASDVDLFKVTASAPVNLIASVDWAGTADLELSISNSSGIFVRHVDTGGHPEQCVLTGLPAGTYTVRVGSFTSAATHYTLTVGVR